MSHIRTSFFRFPCEFPVSFLLVHGLTTCRCLITLWRRVHGNNLDVRCCYYQELENRNTLDGVMNHKNFLVEHHSFSTFLDPTRGGQTVINLNVILIVVSNYYDPNKVRFPFPDLYFEDERHFTNFIKFISQRQMTIER